MRTPIRLSKSALLVRFFVLLVGLASAMPAVAKAQALTLGAGVGAYGGGDEVARVSLVDPSGETSSSVIKAGTGVEANLSVGYFPLIKGFHSLGVEALFGARFWSARRSAGRLLMVRVPLDLMGVYRFRFLQIAAGPTFIPIARLKGRGVLSDIDGKFDPAVGGNVELGGLWGPKYFIGARYTYLRLPPRGAGRDIDAWSVGLTVRAYFSVWGELAPTKPELDEE